MRSLLDANKMPCAARSAVPIEKVSEDYAALTTLIPIDSVIDGESTIERFARDQAGRDFLVGVSAKDAAIYVNKRHLLLPNGRRDRQRETYRAIPIPTKCGFKEKGR